MIDILLISVDELLKNRKIYEINLRTYAGTGLTPREGVSPSSLSVVRINYSINL